MGNQNSSLHSAAANNDLGKVEALIAYQHANVNERDQDGWTPLHFAAYGGALEVAQGLLLRGAMADATDKADRTPLHLAALQSHSALATLLIGRGAAIDAKDENFITPFHKAAIKGNVEVGEQLLRLGASIEAAVKDGTRAIHLAAWKGHAEFVKLLLGRGADVRAVTNNGRTALHEAAESGHAVIVQLLLAAGANPHAQDKDGHIPASLASHSGHKDIAEVVAGRSARASEVGGMPSAPPLPTGGAPSGSHVQYPKVYQGGTVSEASAEAQHNKDFWNQNLSEKDKEKGQNQGFWGAALGGSSAPQPTAPRKDSATEEVARNKAFWDEKLAGGIPALQQKAADWDARLGRATGAWDAQIQREQAAGTPPGRLQQQHTEQDNPRKQFEQNVLRQAQGLWNMLQGKGGAQDQEARKRQEADQKRQEIDAEWGGRGSAPGRGDQGWGAAPPKVPTQELYNLKPYEDDDDYEEEQPAAQQRSGGAHVAQTQRRLAQLELDLDREQGWIRGGSKADVEASKARQQRIKEQEAEIAALKKQLAGTQHTFGGRTGGRDLDSAVPSEYLCPITQEIMVDPVIAGDGYTYERGPIQQWLSSGHNTSPMTGGKMPKSDLTPNNALRSAIRKWHPS